MRMVGLTLLALACALAAATSAAAHGRLLAPRGVCTGDSNIRASSGVQKRGMRCLHNFARRRADRRALRRSRQLDRAAAKKAYRIVACRDFSHRPCGTSFSGAYRSTGYGSGSWSIGENIGWGSGRYGSARSIFHRWLHSYSHRRILLRRGWRHLGVARRHADRLFGYRNVTVWVAAFGRP